MVLRCIRPDRVVPAVLEFVAGKLGEKFVKPPPFDLAGSYADSNVAWLSGANTANTVARGPFFESAPAFPWACWATNPLVAKAMSPLIFILSPGADPGSNLYRFAGETLGLACKIQARSMSRE